MEAEHVKLHKSQWKALRSQGITDDHDLALLRHDPPRVIAVAVVLKVSPELVTQWSIDAAGRIEQATLHAAQKPLKRSAERRVNLHTILAALLGAGLALGGGLLKSIIEDKFKLPDVVPDINVSRLDMGFTSLFVPGDPLYSNEIARQRRLAEMLVQIQRRGLSIPIESATSLIELAGASGQMDSIKTNSGYIDNTKWALNVNAVYRFHDNQKAHAELLARLSETLKSGSPEEQQTAFRQTISENPSSRGAFNALVGVCLRVGAEDPRFSRLDMKQAIAAPVVWPFAKEESDTTYAFGLRHATFVIDYFQVKEASDRRRNQIAETIAELVSRMTPEYLCPVLEFGRDVLRNEVSIQERFLEASNSLLGEFMSPDVEVSMTVTNSTKHPATIGPWGVLEVWNGGESVARWSGTIHSSIGEKSGTVEQLAEKAVSERRPGEYVTIAPGASVIVMWLGDELTVPSEWKLAKSAYDVGAFQCTMTVANIRGRPARSECVSFVGASKRKVVDVDSLLRTAAQE